MAERAAVRALVTGALLVAPAGIAAQEDVQRVSIAERARPQDTRPRWSVGPFLLNPDVVAATELDDNIFATDTDRDGDLILTLRPELVARLDVTGNALRLSAYAEQTLHARFGQEDSFEFGGAVDGRLELDPDTRLLVRTRFDRQVEQRGLLGSFSVARRRVTFDSTEADVGLEREFGPLRLRAGVRARRLNYHDVAADGVTVDQDFRDLNIYTGVLQAGYSRTGLSQVYARSTVDVRRFDKRPGDPGFDPLTQTDRSADGGRFEVGYARQVTAVFFGSARIGYLSYDYADPRLRDVSGVAFGAEALWNVTPLTSITAALDRTLDETSSPLTAGNLRSQGEVRVDHELLRNLILSADARLAFIDPAGLSDKSTEAEAGLSARYLFSRRIAFTADVRHVQRASNDQNIAFRSNRLLVGATLRF